MDHEWKTFIELYTWNVDNTRWIYSWWRNSSSLSSSNRSQKEIKTTHGWSSGKTSCWDWGDVINYLLYSFMMTSKIALIMHSFIYSFFLVFLCSYMYCVASILFYTTHWRIIINSHILCFIHISEKTKGRNKEKNAAVGKVWDGRESEG